MSSRRREDKTMKRYGIVIQIGVLYAALVGILVSIAWLGSARLARLHDSAQRAYEDQWAQAQLSQQARLLSNLNNRITLQIFLMEDKKAIEALRQERAENTNKITRLLSQIEAHGIKPGRERELMDRVQATRWPYVNSYVRALHLLVDEGKRKEATEILARETVPLIHIYHQAYQDFTDFQMQQANDALAQMNAAYVRAEQLYQLQIIVGSALALGIALFSIWRLGGEMGLRETAESELAQLNTGLEQKVQLRTEELAKANRELSQEVEDRKAAEEAARKAKEAAEAAHTAKGAFLANMSHEIRTPMNGVMGALDLLLDTELDTEQLEYLTLAKGSAESLLTLLNDILDFSKIEAGKLDIEAIGFKLRDSLGDAIQLLSLKAQERGLELMYEVDPAVPDALVGDPGRLRQILLNLVGNAIKFTERGEVVVTVELASKSNEHAELHFTVSDTGVGIAKEKQEAIFAAFSQGDTSTTRRYGGTGLGLTISARLLELMRGRIWVESEPGRGSRFHFIVRFDVQQAAPEQVAPGAEPPLRETRVLIVDDNATNRSVLLRMLKNWGVAASAVESGKSALSRMEEACKAGRPFQLVLLDAQMPEMDGFTLARNIMADSRWQSVTLVMLTSAGERGDAARCRELGISAYLHKPVKQSDLYFTLVKALGSTKPAGVHGEVITRHTRRESGGALRILLVEDNKVNQILASKLLEKRGYLVSVAEDGERCLALLQALPIDLVLMDVQMPGMGGLEATRLIREKEKKTGEHLPIIAMTALAMQGDEQTCLEAGMDGYIAKPIKSQELFRSIEMMCPALVSPKSASAA
jgi:signal transduction histidine kinase/DNA-binding response OmpR family regulator/flagellar basal body-associated protein FliL